MRGFQHPVGPESPHTYWVRRGVLVAVLVLIIVLLVWLLSTLLGNNASETTAVPAASSSAQTSIPVNPSWTDTAWGPTPSPSSPTAGASSPTAGSASGSPTGSASQTPSVGTSSTPTPSRSGPVACSASTTTVSLTAGSGSVAAGSKVAFTVALANTSKTDCTWDFAKLPVSVSVTSGSDRIWSSGDCAAWMPRGVAKVPAGRTYSFGVAWPAQRSTQNSCKLSTGQLGAGYYVATAQAGDTVSKKFVMQVHQ